jgi:hypothetical protein
MMSTTSRDVRPVGFVTHVDRSCSVDDRTIDLRGMSEKDAAAATCVEIRI